jgi:GTPase KRas
MRQVTPEEGQGIASKWLCPFMETSAKARINVDEMWVALVREVREMRLNPPAADENAANNPPPARDTPKEKRKMIGCILL